jgi:hypothetical protein
MSNETIPDIFIKEINLFDAGNNEMTVKVTTMIDDVKNLNSWSFNETSKHLKVLFVASSNGPLNNLITEGKINFDKDSLSKDFLDDDSVKIITKPAKSLKMIETPENFTYLDSYEVNFSNKEADVRVFCGVYFEMSEILQKVNLDLSGPFRRYGNIASESVISLGNVVQTATVFSLPNGQQYIGPVHFHPDKGYMVGAKHVAETHDRLTTFVVTNYKIKDFRKNTFSFPISYDTEKISSFGNLNYSINSLGNPTGIFSINFKNLIFYNTKYGNFLKMLSRDALLQNLNNIKIKNFQIVRMRKDTGESNIVVTGFSDQPGAPLNTVSTETSYLTEIITNNEEIRTFQFTDKTIFKNSIGKYTYHINLSFTDPSVTFVVDNTNDLRNSEKEMFDYFTILNKNKNYDYEMQQTKPRFYLKQLEQFTLNNYDNPSWASANELYVRIASYLYKLSETEKINLLTNNSTKIDPRNATIFSLERFNEELAQLSNDFQRIFTLSNNNIQADSQRAFVKTANSANVVFVNHSFKQAYKPQNYFISFNYIDFENIEGASVITKEFFENRISNEYDKFFNYTPNDKQTELIPSGYETLLNLQENSYSYLSPRKLILGSDKIDLTDIRKIDFKTINRLFSLSFDRNIYNLGKNKKIDLENVSEEMSKPKQIKPEEPKDAS